MKLILSFLIAAQIAQATFTLVQVKNNTACSSAGSCTVTVTSTGSGHVIVVGLIDSANQTITSVTGGGTYTLCTGCASGNATAGWVDMAYTLNSTSGTTSIVINHTSGSNNSIGIAWEYSFTGSAAFDASSANLVTVNCTACAGTSLTISGSNDVISTVASSGSTSSALTGTGWTNDLANPGGDACGHALNVSVGTGPVLNQSPTSNMVSAAIAIKDASGSTPTLRMPSVY